MADVLSAVLTHLTNLVSFRSSLRLLAIAGSIICCWVFIKPELSPFNLPNELSLTLITVIGFSLGALVSSMLFSGFDLVINVAKGKIAAKKKKLELQNQTQEKDAIDRRNIELVRRSFNDYSSSALSILLELKDNGSSIKLDSSSDSHHNIAFDGLLESNIVLLQHKLDKNTVFCIINPLYKEAIKQSFEEKYSKEVEELFDLNPDGFKMLIKKFQNSTYKENHIFNIVNVIYRNRYNYSPVIKFSKYKLGGAFDERGKVIDGLNIYFYIPDEYYPSICEKLGGEVRMYVFGNYNEEYD